MRVPTKLNTHKKHKARKTVSQRNTLDAAHQKPKQGEMHSNLNKDYQCQSRTHQSNKAPPA